MYVMNRCGVVSRKQKLVDTSLIFQRQSRITSTLKVSMEFFENMVVMELVQRCTKSHMFSIMEKLVWDLN